MECMQEAQLFWTLHKAEHFGSVCSGDDYPSIEHEPGKGNDEAHDFRWRNLHDGLVCPFALSYSLKRELQF